MDADETSRRQLREMREFQRNFADPKTARRTWSERITEQYYKPVRRPVLVYDKDHNLTVQSQIEQAVYDELAEDITLSGEHRLPLQGEFMEACQSYYARHNPSAYVARRDSLGAKPVDESKQNIVMDDPLKGLTDEQLQALYRMKQENEKKED